MSHHKTKPPELPLEHFHYVILMAPSLAGKDTLARELEVLHDFAHVGGSACIDLRLIKDDDFRHRMSDGLADQKTRGALYSDEVVMETLDWNISYSNHSHKDLIINGIPRTIGQARLLGPYLHRLKQDCRIALITIDDLKLEELQRRALIRAEKDREDFERGIGNGVRSDDLNPETVERKFKAYMASRDQLVAVTSKYARHCPVNGYLSPKKRLAIAATFLGLRERALEKQLISSND